MKSNSSSYTLACPAGYNSRYSLGLQQSSWTLNQCLKFMTTELKQALSICSIIPKGFPSKVSISLSESTIFSFFFFILKISTLPYYQIMTYHMLYWKILATKEGLYSSNHQLFQYLYQYFLSSHLVQDKHHCSIKGQSLHILDPVFSCFLEDITLIIVLSWITNFSLYYYDKL